MRISKIEAINRPLINNFNDESKSIEELAILTARAMMDLEFRKHIKNEAIKQFDGDFDILYSTLSKKTQKSSNSENFYLEKLSSNQKSTDSYTKNDIETLIAMTPMFQISVPVHCEKWNINEQVPLVTYVPANFDENYFTKVKAFDSEGNLHWLSLDEVPDFPIVVLGSNERTDKEGNLKYLIDETGFRFQEAPDPDDNPIDDPYPDIPDIILYRSNGLAEYVNRIKVPDLNDYEPWLLGKPEFRLRVYSQYGTELCSVPKQTDRDVKDSWRTINLKLFNWYWGSYGDYLLFSWFEEDGGSWFNFTISLGTVGNFSVASISFPVGNNDDNIGHNVIHKLDILTTQYEIGGFYWYEQF